MELHALGLHAQPHLDTTSKNNSTPISNLQAQAIKILWSSWCDAVVAHSNLEGLWHIEHVGLGLTANQKAYIAQAQNIKDAVSESRGQISFFGGVMHDGLRGYVISNLSTPGATSYVVVFGSDLDIEAGILEVQTYTVGIVYDIVDIKVASAGNVLVSIVEKSTRETKIANIHDLTSLHTCLTSATPFFSSADSPIGTFSPCEWAINATTSTALDEHGKVHTSTRDPRYPKCLGRPYNDTEIFEKVPYLSETSIIKIASGGFMTVAISSEGELFLWGQACPGSVEELSILKVEELGDLGVGELEAAGQSGFKETGITMEDEQDDFVKCLTIHIHGEVAKAYDVAVGHGHVLVAAEVLGAEKGDRRAVFAAGLNQRGQTGINTASQFVENFQELLMWRGKKVAQLVAAGWSSFVIVS